MKYSIPKRAKQPRWVHKHFAYINKKSQQLSPEQLECNSEMTKIADRYSEFTDKGPHGPYYIKHNYTELYGDLLRFYKDKKINLLEVGVRGGGSLMMWSDFFEKGEIHGIDIDISQIGVKIDKKRIHLYEGDAYTKSEAKKIFGNKKFDIIVDDGSHILDHQISFLNIYCDFLSDGGVIIIEDIKDIRDARKIIDSFSGHRNKCSIIDRTHCVPSLDDINVVFFK